MVGEFSAVDPMTVAAAPAICPGDLPYNFFGVAVSPPRPPRPPAGLGGSFSHDTVDMPFRS